jgi:hypothetical protein
MKRCPECDYGEFRQITTSQFLTNVDSIGFHANLFNNLCILLELAF